MNTIFLPNPEFQTPLKDNTLQINVTSERLQFMEGSVLKEVRNKGLKPQKDVMLTGIPYQQTITDRLNVNTGKVNLEDGQPIHFEQGLFLRTPETTNPKNPPTISRMASIPHGTAFTAQDFEPQKEMKKGAPLIPDINITPFDVLGDEPRGKFNIATESGNPYLDNITKNVVDNRQPGDFTKFESGAVLNLENTNNPNKFLQDANAKKTFAGHWNFTVQTDHSNKTLLGGGVSNIAFLQDGHANAGKGNANATNVTCEYWVSILTHTVDIPAGDYTSKDAKVLPRDDVPGVPGPVFQIQVKKKLTEPKTVSLNSTQIQYSQNVRLDFGPKSWPHVSVATLAPLLPIFVPSTDPALSKL